MNETNVDLTDAKLLIVDDVRENLNILRQVLGDEGYKISVAMNGRSAIKIAKKLLPDLILLDVMMPEMDGFETCRQLKQNKSTNDIPIIFVTAKTDHKDLTTGFLLGAVDYIIKPFNHEEVLMRVHNHLQTRILINEVEANSRAKSSFLANMSHELRTPLNAIIGYSEMLAEDALDDNNIENHEDLKKITTASKFLLRLINNVLDISKIEAGKMPFNTEKIDIDYLLEETNIIIKPLANNNNKLTITNKTEVNIIHNDLTKLQQILFNLLNNACKFTQNGIISLVVSKHDEWMQFEIIDNGIGLTEGQASKLFQDFSQATNLTSSKYGGTGLGLSLSKKFAKIMGGDIILESEFGKGSNFIVKLPLES
jgi:signal transduction histidine kinase